MRRPGYIGSVVVVAAVATCGASWAQKADVSPETAARASTRAPTLSADEPDAGDRMERLSFDEAVRRATAHNPNVTIANAEVKRADALVRQVRSAALPSLSASLTYTRLDGDRILGGGATCYAAGATPGVFVAANCPAGTPGPPGRVIAGADQLSGNLLLSVPLIAAPRWVQWSHARENVGVSRLAVDDTRRQIALATGRAYLTIVSQKHVVAVTRTARDAAHAHFEFAHSRYLGGVGNRLDEVRAAQEMATDEAQLQTALSNLARARESLGVLIGSESPVDAAEEPRLGDTAALHDALADTEARRSDIQLAKARVKAAHNLAKDSWTDYLPYLTGVFQPFIQDPPSLSQPLYGWQAQLILGLPLYDGGLRYGQRRERQALESEARAGVEAALRQARSDVRVGFEVLRRADDSLRAARDAARLNHEALDLAQLAYHAGATTNIEVIDAERRARDADTTVAVAEDTSRQARLDLLAGSGRFP